MAEILGGKWRMRHDKTEACGCTMVLGRAGIRYCPTHAAAPAMLAALENVRDCGRCDICEDEARLVVAQARGEATHA